MSLAKLSDYFLNIDTRADELADEDAAFDSWLEDQDFLFLLNAEAADLLNDAYCGVDIRSRVQDLVDKKYREYVTDYQRDCAFDEASIWDC